MGHLTALGLHRGRKSETDITKLALWCYALYRAHNLLRHHPLGADEDPLDILKQFAKEGASGHSFAAAVLGGSSNHTQEVPATDRLIYFDLLEAVGPEEFL